MRRTRALLCLFGLCALIIGCSEETTERPDGGTTQDGTTTDDIGTGPALRGVVKDSKGAPVESAKVEVGSVSAFTDMQGKYTVKDVTPGAATVKVTQDWFKEKTESVTIKDVGATDLDIAIEEHPLKIDPADQTLADTYNQTFDWTKDKVSVVVLPSPTRKNLDNAVYYHNPALYRDTSGEAKVTPSPLPSIGAGGGKNFKFTVEGKGVEALDASTISDDNPLTAAEKKDYLMFRPMLNWLLNWDATKPADLNAVGVAVRQQNWGSNAVRPQEIEQVYLKGGTEIWVKVVFENFVELGSGITDKDGDGRKEIYAKVDPQLYTSEIVTKLNDEYIKPTYDTHGMSRQINDSLNELYTTTAAEIEKYIGQSFDLPDSKGTIQYPFVVLKHSEGQQNVLLVGPAQ